MQEKIEVQKIEAVDRAFDGEALLSLTLSEARSREPDDVRRVTVRPILLRKKRVYQFEYQYAQKVQHRNLERAEARALVHSLLADTFRQGYFYTTAGESQVAIGRTGKVTVHARGGAQAAPIAPPSHDRQKNYLLAEGEPVPFLVRLGVMAADGRVVAAKRDKFKQINRFLEMVDDVASSLPAEGELHVIDFGCGKAYLTFALYHYLSTVKGRAVRLVGLDLKEDVVLFCAKVAQDLGCEGLTFAVGEIGAYAPEGGAVDMVVTLHACDTATDDALVKAVAWGARVILSVPCCQHELFGQLASDVMRPLLKHGILKERLTALVTDSARASLLESAGYSVQVLEFIALEHTAKNLLIRAIRREGWTGVRPPSAEYAAFRDFWHIKPALEAGLAVLTMGEAPPAPNSVGAGEGTG